VQIAQLSTRYPPGPGGVERHVAEISRRLVARGHRVTALTSELYREIPWQRLGPEVPRRETSDGIEIRRLPVWTLPGELHYPFFRGLGGALASVAPDLVHVHTYGTNHAAVARRYHRRARVPYVITAHYHPIWSIHGGWLRHRIRGFYDRVLAAPIVAEADTLIVQTHEEERLVRENGFPLPRVAIIPPGYTPLANPLPGERAFSERFGIAGPFALFVGRLASNKGLVPLIEGFAILAKREPEARLVIVGEDGGVRPEVERSVRAAGLERRVHLTGFVSDESLLASAFREARVFVLPSEYESFGLVLLEAMAQGTPVIASRVGGIPEFVADGQAGLLVPPLQSGPLADALLSLWNDEDRRRRMGEFGRIGTVPRYTWDRVVDRLLEVYAGALGR
jgi:glycosyltransferase involved in cell wall biosynthesis